jgi:cyclohexanone monooxygenase
MLSHLLPDEVLALVGEIDFDPDEVRERNRFERDKRLRKDNWHQWVEVTAEFSHYEDDPYCAPITRDPVHDEVDVVIIGAGFSGLLSATRLREIGIKRIRLIETGGDVGGTWYWNRYPGCACDVESYVYIPLLEELSYIPQHRYSYAPEIFEHCQRIARHYDLYDLALLQTDVTGLEWQEGDRRWLVSTSRDDRILAQFVVMGTGPIERPKLPGIPGINELKVHTFHTSRWDYTYTGGDWRGDLTNLHDKVVGIIGTGATAVQCVPPLAASAKHLFVFQRTPSTVDVRANRETDIEWVKSLEPGWQPARQENFNILVDNANVDVDLVNDSFTDLFKRFFMTTKAAAAALDRRLTPEEKGELQELIDFKKVHEIRARVDALVEDPNVAEVLKPWYRYFCKRPCFSDNYLQTFNRPNVTLVDTNGRGVDRFTEHGVVVGENEYTVDCLIFATGFDQNTEQTHRVGFDAIGRGGQRLSQKWAQGPKTHLGTQIHGFPNLFMVDFVQTAVVVSVTHMLDQLAQHNAYIIGETRARGAEVVEVTAEAEQLWQDEMKKYSTIGREVFLSCTPGYITAEGDFIDNPWSIVNKRYGRGTEKFIKLLRDFRETGQFDEREAVR